MHYTNEKIPFRAVLEQALRTATGIDVCVGYCDLSAVKRYAADLTKVARLGRVRLVLGMYRSEGAFSKSLCKALLDLHKDLLLAANANGHGTDGTGVYVTEIDYHGKL